MLPNSFDGRASVLASPDLLRVPKMFGLARTLALPVERLGQHALTSAATSLTGLAPISATLPSKSVVRTWVELRGTTVFIAKELVRCAKTA